jgi:hypothetical protein
MQYNSTNGVVIESNMRPYEALTDLDFLFSASIVYAFGCLLLLVSLIVGSIAFCKPKCGSCSLFLFSFCLQALAGELPWLGVRLPGLDMQSIYKE